MACVEGRTLLTYTGRMNAFRVTRTYVQSLHSPRETVFPLLCPVREADWLEDWQCAMVYSDSGVAEPGCVFTTPHHGDTETVWYVADYEPPRHIRFVRVTPDTMVVDIDIALALNEDGPDRTVATVRYAYTALSDKGRDVLEPSTEEEWVRMMRWWEDSLNHYLRTGQRLSRSV